MAKKNRGKWGLTLVALGGFTLGLAGCQGDYGTVIPATTGCTRCQFGPPPASGGGQTNTLPGVKPASAQYVQAAYYPGQTQPGGSSNDMGPPLHPEKGPHPKTVPLRGPPEIWEGVPTGDPSQLGGCPRELRPVSHPPYTIAPPDILFLDAVRLLPKPPYRIEPLEVLLIQVSDTLPNQPILGQFVVSPEGMINLGFNYGAVRVGGLTLDQVQTTIRTHLGKVLRNPQVTVALAQFRGIQQVRGQHLVRPDGTISLGTYGAVYVSGLTLGQAKCVIEKHLSHYLQDPQISVDVFAYNSKVYYVIYDGGGFGQQIFRLPATGNETVLDAISQVQGLAPVSSKKRIWLARPAPEEIGCSQVLPVNWQAITMAGDTGTNYQVFPGDRIYVDSNCLIRFDNYLSMALAPVERLLGITLLGSFTAQSIRALRTGAGEAIIAPIP